MLFAVFISMVFMLVWAVSVEYRLHLYRKGMLTMIDTIKTQSDMMRETNTKTDTHGVQLQTAFNAIEGKSHDIHHIVQALNQLSYEVNQNEILRYKEKHTIN